MKVIHRDKYKKTDWSIGFAFEILKKEYAEFEVTVLVEETDGVVGTHTNIGDKDNLVYFDPDKSYNAEWDHPELSTIARQRTQLLKTQDLPEEYKRFVSCMIDIAHEVGHIKVHNSKEGKNTLDMDKYTTDLEYRIKVETEAEEETTRIAKKYGFYDLINKVNFKKKK